MQTMKDVISSMKVAPSGTGAGHRRPEKALCSKDCEICGGTGYYRWDVPPEDDRFGKINLCPNVSVWRLTSPESIGLYPEELEGLGWDAILPLKGSGAPYAARVVQQVIAEGGGLVHLYGTHGQAKTLILKIAVAEFLRQNRLAAYANMTGIISNIRQAFDERNPSTESAHRLERWKEMPLLAIDEFDRFNQTTWAESVNFELMDARYTQAIRGQAITLIASNAPPEGFDSYYASRLRDGRFVSIPLMGEDQRPNMHPGTTW